MSKLMKGKSENKSWKLPSYKHYLNSHSSSVRKENDYSSSTKMPQTWIQSSLNCSGSTESNKCSFTDYTDTMIDLDLFYTTQDERVLEVDKQTILNK